MTSPHPLSEKLPKDSDIRICSKGEAQPPGGSLNSANTPNPEKKKQVLIFKACLLVIRGVRVIR